MRTPLASVLWVMSGETTFKTTFSPGMASRSLWCRAVIGGDQAVIGRGLGAGGRKQLDSIRVRADPIGPSA